MVFETLFQTALGAFVLTLVIMLISRIFGEKMNPNIRYFLWLFVALRILIPVSIDYAIPEIGWLQERQELVPVLKTDSKTNQLKKQNLPELYNNIDLEKFPLTESWINPSAQSAEGKVKLSTDKLFFIVWFAGAVGLGGYIITNNFKFCAMVKKQRKAAGVIHNGVALYELKGYNCLIGILHPSIYMDPQVFENPKLSQHVIQHELQHHKTKDNFWIIIRVLCLSLQWFNPFVWIAYMQSGRDCELACDYRVIQKMENEERFLYGESLLSIAECKVISKRKVYLATSMGKEKRIMKKRLEDIMKFSKNHKKIWVLPCIFLFIVVIIVFVKITQKEENFTGKGSENDRKVESVGNLTEETDKKKEVSEIQKPQIEIRDFYITNTGDPSNLYYIDDEQILWGSGKNQYGQLGQGTQDWEFYEDRVKIADHVIHVDYSQTGFMIFLTEEHKLYGCGNGGVGALQQLDSFSGDQYINGEHYAVTKPVLLMENVLYARCGRNDIVAIDLEHSVWNWGTIWYQNRDSFDYQKEPRKVLDNTVLVTGGMYNHAALKEDGSVWTWGYNYTGNCGILDEPVVSKPQKVEEDTSMVWTGGLNYNTNIQNIKEFGDFYERGLENTIIQKTDGSFWICGANVGTEEKIIPKYYEVLDYSIICTHEFLPYEMKEENIPRVIQ